MAGQIVVVRSLYEQEKLKYNFLNYHASTLAHEHGVVCSLEHLGEKHLEGKKSENWTFSRRMNKYQGPRGSQSGNYLRINLGVVGPVGSLNPRHPVIVRLLSANKTFLKLVHKKLFSNRNMNLETLKSR